MDIIEKGTISPTAAAYLWLAIDGLGASPFNLIVAGNTGGGKTTTLNALLDLVPLSERIITIEDTRELSLLHRNWVPLVRDRNTTMDDLLRNALRMRPDRIVVGEVRGPEAETLLTAMNVGHSGMGTLHANSARDTIRRLTSPPMEVPQAMIPVINIIIVQHRLRLEGKGVVRRVVEICEVFPGETNVSLSQIYKWDPSKDLLQPTGIPSRLLDQLSDYLHIPKRNLLSELKRREKIITEAVRKKLSRKEFFYMINGLEVGR